MDLGMRLEQFGMTPSEAELYLQLAEVGRSGAHALAKRCGVPRTTTYSVLDSLVRKGFATVERGKSIGIYIASDPDVLLRQLDREREELARRQAEAIALVEEVRPRFRSQFYHVPKIQFFEGREGVEQMLYGNLEQWQRSLMSYDRIWWGYQDHTFVMKFRKWLDYTWDRLNPQELIQLISNSVPIEDELRGRVRGREIRTISDLLEFSSTIWILGDFIILIMSRNEPFYSFQIHDPVFAANLRSVFQLLWKVENIANNGLSSPPSRKRNRPKRGAQT